MPLFAADAPAAAKEKSPFQVMADAINAKGQAKSENASMSLSLKRVTVFQDIADGIKEGSAKAKPLTLRTKQEKQEK